MVEQTEVKNLFERLKQTIKPTRIDDEGVFKYIQILLSPIDPQDPATGGETYLIVRGWRGCEFHSYVLDKFNQDELNTDNQYAGSAYRDYRMINQLHLSADPQTAGSVALCGQTIARSPQPVRFGQY